MVSLLCFDDPWKLNLRSRIAPRHTAQRRSGGTCAVRTSHNSGLKSNDMHSGCAPGSGVLKIRRRMTIPFTATSECADGSGLTKHSGVFKNDKPLLKPNNGVLQMTLSRRCSGGFSSHKETQQPARNVRTTTKPSVTGADRSPRSMNGVRVLRTALTKTNAASTSNQGLRPDSGRMMSQTSIVTFLRSVETKPLKETESLSISARSQTPRP